MAKTWANESLQTNMKINLVDPGPTRTGLRAKAMPGETPENLPSPAAVASEIVDLVSPDVYRTGEVFDRVSGEWLS